MFKRILIANRGEIACRIIKTARKMGISERSLYEYLKVLKDLGAPIKFSRQDHSYYYEIEGQFQIAFQ